MKPNPRRVYTQHGPNAHLGRGLRTDQGRNRPRTPPDAGTGLFKKVLGLKWVHFGSGILKSQLQNQKPAPKGKKVKEANRETMGALLRKIDALGLKGPVRLVLDNGRYQHCALVKDLAKSLNIELLFLPSYSPNLNLIERLWKFTKKKVLYGRHYDTFAAFCGAIDGCLGKIEIDHRKELKSLMIHHFQTFGNASFMAA